MNEIKTSRKKITSHNFVDYYLQKKTEAKEVWLLLHGYSESAQHIVKRLSPIIPSNVNVLAPNGPFPLPKKTQSTTKLGFAWYFYDNTNDHYFIDFTISCEIIENLLKELNLHELPLRIIGYSQGGYLAPFAGLHLKKTFHALGINSSTRVDFINEEGLNFCFDQVHGAEDEFVDIQLAKQRFDKLAEKGNPGCFEIVENQSHYLSKDYLNPINSLITQRTPVFE